MVYCGSNQTKSTMCYDITSIMPTVLAKKTCLSKNGLKKI